MINAQIVTWWTNSGGKVVPHIMTVHDLVSLSDASGQPAPVETPVIVDVVCSEQVLADIQADNDYGDGSIIWWETYNE